MLHRESLYFHLPDYGQLWLPLFLFKQGEDASYTIFRSFEVIFLVISFLLTISSGIVAVKYNYWHRNMITIYASFLFQWFELFFSHLLITPYQEGWIPLSNLKMVSTTPENVPIYLFDDILYMPLLVGGFLRFRYFVLTSWVMPAMVVERGIATYFVSDYERNTRPYISIIAVIISQIVSTVLVILMANTVITYTVAVSIYFGFGLFGLTLFVYLVFRNHHLLNRLNNSKSYMSLYTLSLKYQIVENIRVLIAIKVIIFAVGFAMFGLSGAFFSSPDSAVCRVQLHFSFIWPSISIFIETSFLNNEEVVQVEIFRIVFCHPVVMLTICIWLTPKWRRIFSKVLPKPVQRCLCHNRLDVTTPPRLTNLQTTDMYFKNLEKMW
ncbi:unnamed protein product [Caenorhabditis auriculariae]|uniref:Uncharacterized protein n=1 Tax=Caenorhabditis auriculariae TaxID=2777116 RepID=A0A8S1HVL5_9PELO|nr:unnamed protein product [Caenorhabditis auriculariae]